MDAAVVDSKFVEMFEIIIFIIERKCINNIY